MGRFIKEQARPREGVDIRGVKTDPERLTALVILGIRDEQTFPLIFYRDNCADAALTEDDVDEAYIASARAVVVSGTHFSRPNLDAMSKKAMRLAKKHGGRVIFDIDYRPVLWGLTGHGLGEERFVANQSVSAHLQTILPGCDVIVGTEEEIHIAGGTTDTLGRLPQDPRAGAGRADRGQARADGLHRVRPRHPRRPRAGHQGPGLPDRGVQHPRRRRCLHERLSARLSAR